MILGLQAVKLAAFPVNLIQSAFPMETLSLNKTKFCRQSPFSSKTGSLFFVAQKRQENKKFAKTEKLYLYLIRKQLENSVPTFFFFSYRGLGLEEAVNLIYIYLNSIFFISSNDNESASQFQNDSQLELDEYHEINFFIYTDPGIYLITCNVNGKVYIGEAKNLLDRINKHYKDLENGLSDCH